MYENLLYDAGGFSMGGAMALHLGYCFYPQVAGVLAMSSFLYNQSSVYEVRGSDGIGKVTYNGICAGGDRK